VTRSPQTDRVVRLVLGILIAIAALLLASPTGDGTYTCAGPPAWMLVHPAHTESAAWRQDFFDSGYQCNSDARARGVYAGGMVLFGLLGYSGYLAWRRRPAEAACLVD